MRIFLVGFMGSGKSTTGRALARRLGVLFWDLDARIEASLRMSVADVFARHGEAAFRQAEGRQLAACVRLPAAVVAAGGGTFGSETNRATIARLGVSVFLDLPWGEILRRLPGKREERPLFSSPEQAHSLYLARLPYYRMADVRVRPAAGEDAEALAARIAILLESRV
jgi:shikimate kinase